MQFDLSRRCSKQSGESAQESIGWLGKAINLKRGSIFLQMSTLNGGDDEPNASTAPPEAVAGPSSHEEDSVAPVIDGVDVPAFPSTTPPPKSFVYFTERYFSQYIIRNCKGIEGNNVRLLVHSNGLCLICMDPSHFVRERLSERNAEGQLVRRLVKLSYSLKRDSHRGEPIKCQGKRKKNALLCQREMMICYLELDDGQQIRIPACVDGLILEMNPYLMHRPQLLIDAPLQEGFIAVVNPHTKMDFSVFEKVSTATSGEMTADGDD